MATEPRTREQAIRNAARDLVNARLTNAQKHPRELAEEIAKGAGETRSVEEIEDQIRAHRAGWGHHSSGRSAPLTW